MILSVGERLLRHIGCVVVSAKTGEEAIAAFRKAYESDEPCDAVILDLNVQGGIGGAMVLSRIRRIDPEVKAVLLTAMTNHPQAKSYGEHGFDELLAKPFSLEDMRKVLSKICGKGPGEG